MTIIHWPLQERPREKLLDGGAQQLSNAELLALLWGNGVKGKSAVDLARDLLKSHNNLRGIFRASFDEFCQIPGLGVSKYCQCQAVLELNRRYLDESLKRGSAITQPEQIKNFFMAHLRHHRQEVFGCLFLDNRHRSLGFEKLFYGGISSTSIHIRSLIQRCLDHNAAAVILTHNHPSGIPEPSQADCELTKRLQKALEMIEIRLLDHMIVGDSDVVSFAERGLLAPRRLI